MAKWVHRLSDIDPEARTAICANCGPVRLKQKHNGWRCWKAERQWHDKRTRYRQHKGTVCEECGFIPAHKCQLDVDHIDGDHSNNSPENLQTLCANCHRLKTWQQLHGNTNL